MHVSASHLLLDALVELGVEHVFCNLGTDHAPLIEELARRRAAGRPVPNLVLCPHENTAVHMAAGFAAATGRGQAVLVHVDAGTANAAMAMHNLFRARLPVLLLAGRAPFSSRGELPGSRDTYQHFIQEPFDQGSIVRPYLKWEYTLPSGAVAREVLARAHAQMHSDPMGPVYLMLPREVLAATHDADLLPGDALRNPAPYKAAGTEPQRIAELARGLLEADEPLLITAYAGRQAAAVRLIDELARWVGMRVCEFNPVYLGIDRRSPCFAGFQSSALAESTDFGLLIDVDVPWIPLHTRPNPQATWVQIDVDAAKRGLPLWPFPADVRIEGDSARVLQQLVSAVRAMATPAQRERAAERVRRFGDEHAQRQRAAAARAAVAGAHAALNPDHVCAALGRALRADDIVLDEAIRNTGAVCEQIPRSMPGSFYGLPAGGLGYSGGMALGLKLALPTRRVVHVVGDGTLHFSNPSSLYSVSRNLGLPIFTVVLDNGGWAAVKAATLRMYPQGLAAEREEFASMLGDGMNFALIAQAAGAHGELLDDPQQLDAAIARCLAAVDAGRSALLHVHVARH